MHVLNNFYDLKEQRADNRPFLSSVPSDCARNPTRYFPRSS